MIVLPKEIDLDVTNKCTLKCPGCYRQKYWNGGKVPGLGDISVESWEMMTDYFEAINLIGNLSDPTLHNDFYTLLKIAVKKNVRMVINVASTFRPESWFTKSFLLTKGHDVEWVFAIDGLPKESHKYRINQDGQKLFNIMKRCASMGNKVIWQYIVFNYNENDIDTCRKMAKDINVTFKKLVSSRWGGIEHYKPTSKDNYLERPIEIGGTGEQL